MKALVATARTQGQRPDDFTHCVDGELVYLGVVCDRDRYDPDGPGACGCGRAFIGLNSHRATTTVEVREVALDRGDFEEALRSSLEQAGWDEVGVDADDLADELVAIVSEHPAGAVLGRRIDDILVRAEAG